jgi:nucleotide-binding universal stress UspA family protein
MSGSESSHLHRRSSAEAAASVIAVAVDGHPESRDAAVLAATIAVVTKADVMLVAVHPGAPVVLPQEMGWVGVHQPAVDMVHELRDSVLPEAGTVIESDQSVGQALERVATLTRRDLLVVGSSGDAPRGRVRVDSRTRRLLEQARCAVAVAPSGLSANEPQKLRSIGVGYIREPEAREALELAATLARAAGAKLHVEGVVDDRPPWDGYEPVEAARQEIWDALLESEVVSLREATELAVSHIGVDAEVTAAPGSPAKLLLALSEAVDLLVVGSRRLGPPEQLQLGSTVRTLLHDARCPVVVAPGVTQRARSDADPAENPA